MWGTITTTFLCSILFLSFSILVFYEYLIAACRASPGTRVLIRTDAGNIITYPNNLILQKPVIKLDRGNTVFPQKVPPSSATPSRPEWRNRLRGRDRN